MIWVTLQLQLEYIPKGGDVLQVTGMIKGFFQPVSKLCRVLWQQGRKGKEQDRKGKESLQLPL